VMEKVRENARRAADLSGLAVVRDGRAGRTEQTS
jgi:hypothetical protein